MNEQKEVKKSFILNLRIFVKEKVDRLSNIDTDI